MFSGQGSHYYQMGSELFAHEPVFNRWMLALDAIPREMLGVSIVDLLYHQQKSKAEVFDRTRLTSPAIFMVEYALAQTLIEQGIRPNLVLGASLGIFVAACVAGSADPQQVLAAVVEKSIIIEELCAPGAMVAVLASASHFHNHRELSAYADLASVNSDAHFVLATSKDNLPAVLAILQREQLTYQTLAVSQAFHSRWIERARPTCLELFARLSPRQPRIPVVCTAQAAPLTSLTHDRMWDAVRLPIRVGDTARALEGNGSYRYIDVGPGSTLATQLKYIVSRDSQSIIHPILTPFAGEHRNFHRLITAFREA